MTLDELNLIQRLVSRPYCENRECNVPDCVETRKAHEIIDREIRLKTEDPRTGKTINNCLCVWDEDRRKIIGSNKACSVHGVAAQLQRSQME